MSYTNRQFFTGQAIPAGLRKRIIALFLESVSSTPDRPA